MRAFGGDEELAITLGPKTGVTSDHACLPLGYESHGVQEQRGLFFQRNGKGIQTTGGDDAISVNRLRGEVNLFDRQRDADPFAISTARSATRGISSSDRIELAAKPQAPRCNTRMPNPRSDVSRICAIRRSSPLMVRVVVSSSRMSAFDPGLAHTSQRQLGQLVPQWFASYHFFRDGETGNCTRNLAQYIKIDLPDSCLFIDRSLAYDRGMRPLEQTSRQRLLELLTGTLLSSISWLSSCRFRSGRSKNI